MPISSNPLVSVIIPCYNYAHFLRETVNSVLVQKEDGVNIEVIIVDDGSTDDTEQVSRSFGADIHYIHQVNQGLSAARNTGIQTASGDFLVFLDADDLLAGGALASQLETFQARPELDICVCLCLMFYKGAPEKNYLWPLRSGQLDLHLCQCNISPVHTFMVRRSVVQDVGLFNTNLRACEDQEYWVRCAALGKKMGVNPSGLVLYRQHAQSMSSENSRQLAFDAMLRRVTGDALETSAVFPYAGKFLGWMAYAVGNIFCSARLRTLVPSLSSKILEQSTQAVVRAVSEIGQFHEETRYQHWLRQYFCASYLLAGYQAFSSPGPELVKALGCILHVQPEWKAISSERLLQIQSSAYENLGLQREIMQKSAYLSLQKSTWLTL